MIGLTFTQLLSTLPADQRTAVQRAYVALMIRDIKGEFSINSQCLTVKELQVIYSDLSLPH